MASTIEHPEILRKIPILTSMCCKWVVQPLNHQLETGFKFQTSAQSCIYDAWKSKGAPPKKLLNKGAKKNPSVSLSSCGEVGIWSTDYSGSANWVIICYLPPYTRTWSIRSGWWLHVASNIVYFHPYLGKMNPFWLIVFKWVETTN